MPREGMASIRQVYRWLGLRKTPLEKLARKYKLRVGIHVGAHHGQERELYESLGFTDVLWIEAAKGHFEALTKNLKSTSSVRHVAVNAFASNVEGKQVLRHFSNGGASNSMFSPSRRMRDRWPDVMETGEIEEVPAARLDDIAAEYGFMNCDFLTVDVQGAELIVLQGATNVLANAKCVITEVSTVPYYEGGVLFPELNSFMIAHGFRALQEPPEHGDLTFLRK